MIGRAQFEPIEEDLMAHVPDKPVAILATDGFEQIELRKHRAIRAAKTEPVFPRAQAE